MIKLTQIGFHSKNSEKLPQDYVECKDTNCQLCNLENNIKGDWNFLLSKEFKKKNFNDIRVALHNNTKTFYPPTTRIFEFTKLTSFRDIKVVILGQDPYHNEGQAMGLSFSVPKNIRIPPSLANIFKELKDDIKGFQIPIHGDLSDWAKQGVLLLNDVLTVSKNQPGSHAKIGWKEFTLRIIELINQELDGVVFLLWGNHAREKSKYINRTKHLVLESGHPSPFSQHLFKGNMHFSQANHFLKNHGKDEIDWHLN